jgi:prepilin-type N-terminal cleavage/methylation domain-containing protein
MNKNGFTLIELIMAISIGLVIIAAVYALNEMGQRSSASISQKVVTQQDARAVLDLMAMEIRMAS